MSFHAGWMGRFACEINAHVRRARESEGVGASNFSPGEWATVALPPSWPSSQGAWSWRAPSIKAAAGGLVSFLSLLRHKALASCSFCCRHLLHFRRADTPLPPKAMAGVEAWPPCNVTKSALEARVKAGILRPLKDVGFPEWIVPSANDR